MALYRKVASEFVAQKSSNLWIAFSLSIVTLVYAAAVVPITAIIVKSIPLS